MASLFFIGFVIFTLLVLYHQLPFRMWELGTSIYLLSTLFTALSWTSAVILWLLLGGVVLMVRLPVFQQAFNRIAFKQAKSSLPTLSKTEEEALNTGDTWLEESIFRGQPNWEKSATIATQLTAEEQSFIDNETTELCKMLDEWAIIQTGDLPPNVWSFIKDNGFLGLVIDKKYGGKGFSARAHSEIVIKISTASSVAAVTVMVPNSLGPGELLQYYGTEEQKDLYLPQLAKGKLIPCFALTEPGAGSDATAIESEAIVIEKTKQGKKELYLSITLNKRWITLAPIATLIGLAVNLKDPNSLLKGLGEEGITCLLIPRDTPNLEIGNRHIPAYQPFMNGTIRGKNLIVPISSIIGGISNAGKGWKMLVECLSIGRSISLPALGAASSSVSYLTSSAYARVRRQFSLEIGEFEGVQEKLAEIGGLNYLIQATRLLTVGAVATHIKPSVASGITKYLNTELARIAVNNAMDIHAGRAVVVGPRNYLFSAYQGIPISITVEGANIMSRNLLIFGQGSLACHPYLRDEFYAIAEGDKEAFSRLFWQHIRYLLSNFSKMICSAFTAGWFTHAPKHALKRECQKLTRLSHAYAFLADFSLLLLGGKLKRKERLSARLADGLSYLYAAMATLHYYEQQGKTPDDAIHAKWATQYAFYHTQQALIAFCNHLPLKPVHLLIKWLAFPWGQSMRLPNDHLSHQLSKLMCTNNAYRERMKNMLFVTDGPMGPMEHAFQLLVEHGHLYQKIPDLKRFKYTSLKNKLKEKVEQGMLSQAEMDLIVTMEKARWDAEQVDEFTTEALQQRPFSSEVNEMLNPLEEA